MEYYTAHLFFPLLLFFLFNGAEKRASEGQDCAAAAGRWDAIVMCARP